jgi:hypothetical protein
MVAPTHPPHNNNTQPPFATTTPTTASAHAIVGTLDKWVGEASGAHRSTLLELRRQLVIELEKLRPPPPAPPRA